MDFVIIANAWTAANDNPTGKHQIALQLAEKGHRVLWIEGSGMRKPTASSGSDRSRVIDKIKSATKGIQKAKPNIWRISPLIIPIPSLGFIRMLNSIIYLYIARICAFVLHFKKPTLINFLPIVPLTEKLWTYQTTYFCVDRWDKFDMYDTTVMSNADSACCRYADVVLTTSRDLQKNCSPKNANTTLIGHGVNWDHFSGPLHTQDSNTEIPQKAGNKIPQKSSGEIPQKSGSEVAQKCSGEIAQKCSGEIASRQTATGGRIDIDAQSAACPEDPEAGYNPTTTLEAGYNPTTTLGAGYNPATTLGASPRPSGMPDGRIIGFFGLLSEWVDQDLLVALAHALASSSAINSHSSLITHHSSLPASIVLIGKADVDISRLEAEPNIHLLGSKPFADLPSHTTFFDVAIIPFIINALTIAVNPIKLREMLAAGCPVISTALPEVAFVAEHNQFTETCQTNQEFIDAVLKRINKPLTAEQRKLISASVRNETWSAKVDKILEVIR